VSSRLQDDFSDGALPDILEYAGVACTYTPPTGDPVELTAVLDLRTAEIDQMREGRRTYRSARCTFSKDPTSDYGGVADVSISGTITLAGSGEVWSISDVLAEFDGWITVRVTRSGVISRERHDLRRDKGRSAVRDQRRFTK